MNPNLATKLRFQDAVEAGDWQVIGDCLHPDFTLEEPNVLAYGGTHYGYAGFKAAWEHIRRVMKTLSLETAHTFYSEDPDRFVCELNYRGQVLATGDEVAGTIFERWVFREGKIINIAPHWLNLPRYASDGGTPHRSDR